jgi:hypothetical protein
MGCSENDVESAYCWRASPLWRQHLTGQGGCICVSTTVSVDCDDYGLGFALAQRRLLFVLDQRLCYKYIDICSENV